MVQHTANREPTMEEILASIRRIIESNEAATGIADDGMSDENEGPEPEMAAADAAFGQWPETQAGANPAGGDETDVEDAEGAHFAEAGIEETGKTVSGAGADESAETAMQSVTSASEEKVEVPAAEKTDDILVAVDDVPAAQAPVSDSPGGGSPADDGSGGKPSTGASTPGRPVSLADVAARVRASGLRSLSRGESQAAPSSTASVAAMPANGSAAMRIEPTFEPQETDDPEDDASEPVAESAWYSALPANDSVEAPATAEFADDDVSESEFDVDIRDAVTAALGAETAREALSSAPLGAAPKDKDEDEDEDEPVGNPDADAVFQHDVARSTDGEGASASLMSVDAGRKVSAAFDDLNDAFGAGGRRSFDDIAQDMLRPMLQEWLDDNLPTLVERLVREEIERVARGGKR